MELVKHFWRLEGVCCLLLSRIGEQELSVGEPAFTLYSRVQLGWERGSSTRDYEGLSCV